MGTFRRKVPNHYVPIHPDNVRKRDWLILLEVGSDAPHNIRVAQTILEKSISKTSNIFAATVIGNQTADQAA